MIWWSGRGRTATDDSWADYEIFVAIADPATMIGDLIFYIAEQVAAGGIEPEIQGSLLAKLNAVLAALDRDNPNDAKVAINDLKALVNQVEALVDKRIDPGAAAALIDKANQIIAALGG